jgi:ureidoglycolate lyase
MSREIRIAPLTAEAFAPFGEVLEATGDPDRIINQGLCGRFHDRAGWISWTGARGSACSNPSRAACPIALEMVERHPRGSARRSCR